MTIISVGNQKGGVGKTTTAVALGQYFARRGKRVLIVDLDAQGHVAESLGVDKSGGLFRLICQGLAVEQVAQNVREDLDIIANDHTAEQVKAFAAQSDFRAYILAQALGEAGRPTGRPYDVVFLDMPPSTDVLHVAALVASDYLLVPAIMDHLALTGVMTIIHTARALGKYPNVTPPALLGVLPTLFERMTTETRANVTHLAEALGDVRYLLPPIPRDTKVREASSYGQTIWEYAPASPAAVGYRNGSPVKNSLGFVGGYVHAGEIIEGIIGRG